VHDLPAGRQLRHAHIRLPYQTKRPYRLSVVADITPSTKPTSTGASSGERSLRERGTPPDGTGTKISNHLPGGTGALAGSRPLSTGGPHEAAGMISFSCVRVGR
jgi:hypothetical protein